MSNNSAPLFDRYADMDFSEAKPVQEIPASAQIKAEHFQQEPHHHAY